MTFIKLKGEDQPLHVIETYAEVMHKIGRAHRAISGTAGSGSTVVLALDTASGGEVKSVLINVKHIVIVEPI